MHIFFFHIDKIKLRNALTCHILIFSGKPVPEKSFLTKHGIQNLALPSEAQNVRGYYVHFVFIFWAVQS